MVDLTFSDLTGQILRTQIPILLQYDIILK